jgi:hypothetical protein
LVATLTPASGNEGFLQGPEAIRSLANDQMNLLRACWSIRGGSVVS